jgi:hypothetical protein
VRIQQAVTNFTANAQVGPWLRFDYYETPFDLGLLVAYGVGTAGTLLSATLGIDYVLDNMTNDGGRQVQISQATTVITVTDAGPLLPPTQSSGAGLGHGLAVGDYVQLTGTQGGLADGGYSVASVTNQTTYTLTSGVSQTLFSQGFVTTGRVMQGAAAGGVDNVIKLAPVTARTSINVTCPILAARLHVTAFTTAGLGILVAMQGGVSS